MIKSATLAATEMITPTKIITSATLPARFSFLVAISTIFHSAVIESHYLNGILRTHDHIRRSNFAAPGNAMKAGPIMNRNPLETHQNLVEDPFQLSIDNFYRKINSYKGKHSNSGGFSSVDFRHPAYFDSEYLEPADGFDVIHAKKSPDNIFGGGGNFPGSSGFADSFADSFAADDDGIFDKFGNDGFRAKMKALPDNFHDADASTKVTPDGKVLKNKYEVHKQKGKNFKSYSYSTSNSITW